RCSTDWAGRNTRSYGAHEKLFACRKCWAWSVIIPWNSARLGDALIFDGGLQHHALVELLDQIALYFLPRRLARRIPIATRLRQRGAALGKLGRRSKNIGLAPVEIDAHAVAGLQ